VHPHYIPVQVIDIKEHSLSTAIAITSRPALPIENTMVGRQRLSGGAISQYTVL
jgi:hypothetical protein